MKYLRLIIIFTLLFLNACMVGPKYKRSFIQIPASYKEVPEGWKFAEPCDTVESNWWELFQDEQLNALENRLNISNQNIALAYGQYMQARALVRQAQSAFFPLITANASVTREKSAASSNLSETTISGLGPGVDTLRVGKPFTNYHVEMDATWAPDIWGSVRRAVEASVTGVQANAAQLAAVRLLAQAQLAQYYFQLRGLDLEQKVLEETVNNYQKLLKITQNQYRAGTVSKANILQTQSQLELAKVQAIDIRILRAQYEHAIAVLIGTSPSNVCITRKDKALKPPPIPVEVPCMLLERRPDIAQQERLVAAANAEIGVAVAAFFPVLTLSGSAGYNSIKLSRLFTTPAQFWSLGAQLADTIFDAGFRQGQVEEAKAIYCQRVAQYRQTVLTALQDVEDNLVALRILDEEVTAQAQAVAVARKSLEVVVNGYKAGTSAFAEVLNAEITLFSAERGAAQISYRRMVAAVNLVRALGGGWHVSEIACSKI